jgi:Holliday junction resolvase YEN1
MLLSAAQSLPPAALRSFLRTWQDDLRHELRTDAHGYLGRKYAMLANSVSEDFPDTIVLSRYVTPLTSWSNGGNGPQLPTLQHEQLDIAHLVAFCRRRFSWGTYSGIQEKFFNIIWDPMCIQMLLKNTPNPPALFGVSSILAIHRVSNKGSVKSYRVEFEVKVLSAIVDSCFDHTRSDSQTQKLWVPAPIMERAVPQMVAAYETRRKKNVSFR